MYTAPEKHQALTKENENQDAGLTPSLTTSEEGASPLKVDLKLDHPSHGQEAV